MQDMEAVYRDNAMAVYRYLLSLTHDAALAEDLAQETFCRAVSSIKRYDGSCKISVWLCQIAKHLWYQHLKQHARRQTAELTDEVPDACAQPLDALIGREHRVELYRLIHKLDGPAKEVVLLRLDGEFAFADIGAIMGKTENWARVTFYRAKQKLLKEADPC